MCERILSGLLCALVGMMGIFLIALICAISSSEGDKYRAIVSMLIGGVGALVICAALIIAGLITSARERRPRLRAPAAPDEFIEHTEPEEALRDTLADVSLDEVAEDSLEGDAGSFLLVAEVEPGSPVPAFRALGVRAAGRSAGQLAPLGMTMGSNGSQGDLLRRVDGANCKGRLCWICGREHGPETVHN